QAAHNDEQLRKIYACISRALGLLNDRYGYFFDVKDQGLDYTKSPIPVSKTNAETSFHTDSTAKHYFPDIVGLLCIHPAAQGGDSLVTNAAGAYQDLSHRFPEHAASLCRPLFRDVITPGSTYDEEAIRNNAFPIFSTDQRGFHFRYMRYWVERAYEKLSLPLDQQVIEGMDAIDHYFHQPENRIQFRMERGDMLFVNNRFLCHNRTAFTTSSPPRTLVRSWINWTDHA
ncbi:MAG: TauD/TfdA family dioxygenase, partial [Flavobacteriales bacterium]